MAHQIRRSTPLTLIISLRLNLFFAGGKSRQSLAMRLAFFGSVSSARALCFLLQRTIPAGEFLLGSGQTHPGVGGG